MLRVAWIILLSYSMKIPEILPTKTQFSVIGSHKWAVPRLFELSRDFEVMEIPLNHLNVWKTYEKLTMRELVMHMKTVNDSDLSFPIILDEDGAIMDGRHRIMKAILNDESTIKAVRFEENPEPCGFVE